MNLVSIRDKIAEAFRKDQRVYPCRSNRASQLGHPCERYLVYMRTAWDKQELPPVELEYIFNGGRVIEKHIALDYLDRAGFNPTNQGRDFEYKKFGITGHIDCYIENVDTDNPRQQFACEIKGISPYEFPKIDSAEDMTHSKKVWMRGYPAQLQLYLLMGNKEYGCFLLINKLTYEPKEIWMAIDYQFCEELVKKAERINHHVSNNTLPERTEELDICMKCAFKHLCLPDLKNAEGIQIIDDKEIDLSLERYYELKPLVKEYEELDSTLKKQFEGRNNLCIGDWLITGKWIEFTKPASMEQTVKYWKRKIVNLNGNKKSKKENGNAVSNG